MHRFHHGNTATVHRGGWMIGSIVSRPPLPAPRSWRGYAVLALDYRLATEHLWPASVDDTVAALTWVATGLENSAPSPVQ